MSRRGKNQPAPEAVQPDTTPAVGEQANAFAKDEADPMIAKVADRVVELLVQKKTTDDNLKIQKRNLIGLLDKSGKHLIRHRGMEIRVKVVAQKEQLTIKQLKPIDGSKPRQKKVK